MAKVTVYTTDYCPFCLRAKDLLKRRGIPYQEVQLDEEDDKAWDDLYQRSKMKTVPQIFADEKVIGGFTDLAALDEKDQLTSLKA